MKNHLPLLIAIVTAGITIALATRGISRVRLAMAMQTDGRIQLPIAPNKPPDGQSNDTIVIALEPGGVTYVNNAKISDASLRELLTAPTQRRIVIRARADMNFGEVKSFLEKLQTSGARNSVLQIDN